MTALKSREVERSDRESDDQQSAVIGPTCSSSTVETDLVRISQMHTLPSAVPIAA